MRSTDKKQPNAPTSPSRIRSATINLAAYVVAVLIIWQLARGIRVAQFVSALAQARLALFVPAAVASLVLWIVGDTLMYARLLSYFHVPTSFREMLPAAATHESLQAVNGVAAGTSLVWFIHVRKGVDWLTAGGTLGLLGLIDLQLMAWMLMVSALIKPSAVLGIPWYYPLLAIAGLYAFSAFWRRGCPRTRFARWLYERPSFTAFREANPSHYISLSLMRIPTFAAQGLVLYAEMIAFGIRAPLSTVMAVLPVVLIAGALPITPQGLGPRQAAIVLGFREFGGRAPLLTMSLAHSCLVIVVRLFLGLMIGGTILKRVVHDFAESKTFLHRVQALLTRA
jgi:uncharacterized membrane protein YbhN (UPF0104 family)